MSQVYRIGLDIAKNKFQVHGVDKQGKKLFNKQLNRKDVLPYFANLPLCLVGIEACGGAHYWARELIKIGHDARLISPRIIKPFVVNNKTDAADAAAICEVVGREATKFVSVKTQDQQNLTALHRVRERLIGNRTALINQARALLHEAGITVPQGITKMRTVFATIHENTFDRCTGVLREIILGLYEEFVDMDMRIKAIEKEIAAFAKANEDCKRLLQIPGVGVLTATAVVAHVGDAKQFKNGRAFAACMGLTPRECSSGGKQKLLGISKRGNNYIRKLLIQGARIITRYWLGCTKSANDYRKIWLQNLATRRGRFIASVAQANKTARIVWAVLARGENYQEHFQPVGI